MKVAIVTGASQGIGAGSVARFVAPDMPSSVPHARSALREPRDYLTFRGTSPSRYRSSAWWSGRATGSGGWTA